MRQLKQSKIYDKAAFGVIFCYVHFLLAILFFIVPSSTTIKGIKKQRAVKKNIAIMLRDKPGIAVLCGIIS